MIDIEKDTPVEYSKQSRDYQVFRFVYTTLFNQVKMYVDLIKNIWTDDIDDKLLDLRAYTLNFIPNYQWNNSDLRGVTNNFKYLLRTKGTADAIKQCLWILGRVKGLEINYVDVEVTDGGIILKINEEIADTGNIDDLLRYILPAGCTYEIVKYSREAVMVDQTIVVDSLEFSWTSEGPEGGSEGRKKHSATWYKTVHMNIPTSEKGYFVETENMSYHPSLLIIGSEGDL